MPPSQMSCHCSLSRVTCHVSRVTRSPGACRTRGRRGPSSAVLCHQARLSRLRLAGPKQSRNKKTNKISLPPSPRLRGQLPSGGSPCVGGGVRLLRVARRAVTGRLTLLAAPPRPAVQGPGAGKMRARAETRSRSRGAGGGGGDVNVGTWPASSLRPQPSRRRTMRSRGLGLARPPQCGDASVVVRWWWWCGGAVVSSQ